eukprot:COSAG06_NODE_46177_length_349_cov_0.556000_1_plen_41_part_10
MAMVELLFGEKNVFFEPYIYIYIYIYIYTTMILPRQARDKH